MGKKQLDILANLMVIGFFMRVQFFTMSIIFYEGDTFRTHDKYIPQVISNNFQSLGYISIMLLPTMILYKVLEKTIDKKYEKSLKTSFLIIILILLDIAFYAYRGISILRTLTNYIALNG